jgi:hypothetical protein
VNGLCLDTVSAGSYADVATCAATQSQKWIVRQDGLIQQAGHNWCLYANGWSAGASPSVAGCDPNNSLMKWQSVAGSKALLNRGAGLCLTTAKAATASGTRTGLAVCDGSTVQQWALPGPATLTANSPAPITGVNGLCLDTVSAGSYADVATCAGTQPQKWIVRQDGLIQQAGQNWCLYANGRSAGASPSVAGCDPNNSLMQWQYVASSKALTNKGAGLCLGTAKAATASGTRTSLAACDGSTVQHWTLPA